MNKWIIINGGILVSNETLFFHDPIRFPWIWFEWQADVLSPQSAYYLVLQLVLLVVVLLVVVLLFTSISNSVNDLELVLLLLLVLVLVLLIVIVILPSAIRQV